MTLIDLLIIGVFLYVVFTCYRHTDTLRELGVYRLMLITIAGLGVIALFYMVDLATMHLFPLVMPMARAMEIMHELHLNYMWVVSLVGVGLLVVGLSRLIRVMLPKIASLLQENLSVQEKLERLAGTDTLTNLPNRRLFYQQMERVVALAERSKERMALLFLDLDGFKPVNDQLGHEAGD
ncbi:GGDEF domain-containing protein [Candidatus Reidiella endopervernicosa]|nr:GGDEF domain-containing protein [Candidatus Reidiella endopervernicosa]